MCPTSAQLVAQNIMIKHLLEICLPIVGNDSEINRSGRGCELYFCSLVNLIRQFSLAIGFLWCVCVCVLGADEALIARNASRHNTRAAEALSKAGIREASNRVSYCTKF